MENMSRMNPIVGSSTKKRFIHPNLMVREDARKAIRSKILKSGPSLLIQLKTSKGEFSAIRGAQKSFLWVGNTLVRVLDPNSYFYTKVSRLGFF